MHKELGGDTARTGDPACPEGYSVPYGGMLSSKSWGRGGGGGDVQGNGVSLPKKPLHAMSPAFLDMAEHLPADGKQ